MKNLLKFKKIILIALIAITSVSCDDDDDTPPPAPVDNTITGIAASNPNFSILVEALTRVGLDETLSGTGPFTVFAPTNDAFNAFLDDNNISSLDAVSDAALTQILLNHVVLGSVESTDLETGYIKTLATSTATGTNTMSMYVDLSSGVVLNGVAEVTTPDIMASNGVIHVVDYVIDLPTIVTHAVANPAFSTLVTVATNPAQAAILAALTGPGPLTVFAPTNAGFLQLNSDLIDLGIPSGIAGVPDGVITNVLLYHVLAGNNLAANLTSTDYTTLLGQTFEVDLMGGAKIIDNNARTSNIIITDVQCSNGVIHAIDNAILPSL